MNSRVSRPLPVPKNTNAPATSPTITASARNCGVQAPNWVARSGAARDVIRAFYIPLLDSVDPRTLGKDAKTLLQEFLQSKKISLPTYNVVATHGAAHSQEFEVECLVPKLSVQVFGRGGSRRAAEQAAASLALGAAQKALAKSPAIQNLMPSSLTAP